MCVARVIVFHYTDRGKLPKLSEEELNEIGPVHIGL